MTQYLITIASRKDRDRAAKICAIAPFGTRVRFSGAKRTLAQNDRMWAMLTDVATQVKWVDQVLRPDDWKLIFLDALRREVRMVPNLDGNGLVALQRSSSDLSKEEMSDLMELIAAFGATHGVMFHDRDAGNETRVFQARQG